MSAGDTLTPMPNALSPAIVAIPACNEAERIGACLAALAAQRDGCGSPIAAGRFSILVYANNCSDETAAIAEAFADVCPHPLTVVSDTLQGEQANAGVARRRAMDRAAVGLAADGVLLTTDADSCATSTWFAATMDAMSGGVDCVAGYIDAFPPEIMDLGPAFVGRGRLEDRYLRLIAEIYARCDPRPHDPWPNHRVSSGASLAVTLRAYRAVGGLPAQALGEDIAFTRLLERSGFKVRHPMSVSVGTSCRFDGRAAGGAGDTMRLRHAFAEAPCDDDIEPALTVLWRAVCRRAARRGFEDGSLSTAWAARLGIGASTMNDLMRQDRGGVFEAFWMHLEAVSPVLMRRRTLRPAELPHQIARAEAVLRQIHRASIRVREDGRADRRQRPIVDASEVA